MSKVCIDLDDVDLRVAEYHMYKLRDKLHLPELEMESYLLYCVKQICYLNEALEEKS